MKIRPDAREKLSHCLTLLELVKLSRSKEIVEQHLDGIERLIQMCLGSLTEE